MKKKRITISKNPNKNWQNDDIQFPRLIAEMEAAGVFAVPGVLKALSVEMDLTVDELCGLISRAQTTWDGIKERLVR